MPDPVEVDKIKIDVQSLVELTAKKIEGQLQLNLEFKNAKFKKLCSETDYRTFFRKDIEIDDKYYKFSSQTNNNLVRTLIGVENRFDVDYWFKTATYPYVFPTPTKNSEIREWLQVMKTIIIQLAEELFSPVEFTFEIKTRTIL